MDTFADLALGLRIALAPAMLLYCFIGVAVGTLVGVLPGIGAMATISLLLPVTYQLEPTAAIVMLAGVYYGAQYGGSTASILLNLPGTPSSAVACLDGYPMARAGRAGAALFTTAVASFVGAMTGVVLLAWFTPSIAALAMRFGPYEYFAMMLLGLVTAATLASGSPLKGMAMVVLGLLLGTVGTDVQTGVRRYDFGIPELGDGLSLVALAMGLFGVAEVIASVGRVRPAGDGGRVALRSMWLTRSEWRSAWPAMLRGSAIGSFFGALPGTGAAIASFMAYAAEKRIARSPQRFGHGAIEGLAAPEAANNAAAQTAFVPTLALGIPGDAMMALMIAALVIHGIQPGPLMLAEQPAIFWGLVASFVVGNLMLVVLNIPLIGIWVAMLRIPYRMLYPSIVVFVCLGVYSVNRNTFDVVMVAVIGIAGHLLAVLRLQVAPLLLGFVLGPPMEEHLRRALLLARGDATVFLQRPISAALLVLTLLVLTWGATSALRRGHLRRSA